MMARLQEPQDDKRQMRKRLALLVVVVVPLVAGAIVWTLSAGGFITGPWSSLFGPLFTAVGAVATVVGVVVTLFQWSRLSPTGASSKPPLSPMLRRHMSSVRTGKVTNLGAYRRRGSLIVIGNRKLSGSTVHVRRGFDRNDSSADVASNIVWCKIDDSPTYAAVFPALKRGNYTASVHPVGPRANVTIQVGQIAEIDWRLYANEKS